MAWEPLTTTCRYRGNACDAMKEPQVVCAVFMSLPSCLTPACMIGAWKRGSPCWHRH